jgi:serine/threonine protein kinase
MRLGTRVGPYEILAVLGAGGMGEVYRARDHRLNRDVAVKVLRPAVIHDPDRPDAVPTRGQLLAALNHLQLGSLNAPTTFRGCRRTVLASPSA